MNPSYQIQNRVKGKIKNIWANFLVSRAPDLVHALRLYFGPIRNNLANIPKSALPETITGFHDLAYLFANHQANRGIIAQDFDEAAYLWAVVTKRKPAVILEIGRWLGGSTVLLASAAQQNGGIVISVDAKIKAPNYASDETIQKHLNDMNLGNVELHVCSSFSFNPGKAIDLAFIDGDHSYEGVKRDFDNVLRYSHPGTDLLFHDSCRKREFATFHEEVARLMSEIKEDNRFKWISEVGSITHFRII